MIVHETILEKIKHRGIMDPLEQKLLLEIIMEGLRA